MRDELSHIRNQKEERRSVILAEHKRKMTQVYSQLPELKSIDYEIGQVKKEIISLTLKKLKGQALSQDICKVEERLNQLRLERKDLLDNKGITSQALEPQWDCKLCKDTGKIYVNDENFKTCTCLNSSREDVLRSSVSLPLRLINASFSNVNYQLFQPELRKKAQKAFEYVQTYCDTVMDSQGHGLYIHGPTGAGKSYMLGCIANHLYSKMSVKYLVYADFLDSLRATFNSRDNASEQAMIDEVKNTKLLLLDDLGVEKPTEFALKSLAQIIDYRYRNCLPIVVTSNFTLEELKNRNQADLYGERIVWRLNETCSILNLEGNLRLNL